MDETICRAIRARKLLMFEYADLMRVVEPHLYGKNSAGHDALTAWLRPGHSRSTPSGGWRMYLVSEMHYVQELDERFDNPRAGYNPLDPRMTTVYCAIGIDERDRPSEPAGRAGEGEATADAPRGD